MQRYIVPARDLSRYWLQPLRASNFVSRWHDDENVDADENENDDENDDDNRTEGALIPNS